MTLIYITLSTSPIMSTIDTTSMSNTCAHLTSISTQERLHKMDVGGSTRPVWLPDRLVEQVECRSLDCWPEAARSAFKQALQRYSKSAVC